MNQGWNCKLGGLAGLFALVVLSAGGSASGSTTAGSTAAGLTTSVSRSQATTAGAPTTTIGTPAGHRATGGSSHEQDLPDHPASAPVAGGAPPSGTQPQARPTNGPFVAQATTLAQPLRLHTPIIYDPRASAQVAPCGPQLCVGANPIHLYGASEYGSSSQTGINNVPGTIALAQQMRLNTIRVINFYNSSKSPTTEPYNETQWVKVDNMIAAAGNAGMHVDLSLGDYRNTLWNNCINPYTADWGQFINFVAQRQNTVTGQVYGNDPTIALLSLAGEPLQVGAHTFTASGTGLSCTITYSTQDLTDFYTRTLHQWKLVGTVSVNSGGLGYLNFNSGIDWKTILALADNDVCNIKTYGGMMQYAPTVAAYCASINKPWVDEEFGYKQSDGDAQRAQEMKAQYDMLHANNSSGEMFWNLGEQLAPTTYDIGSGTPLTMAAVQAAAP